MEAIESIKGPISFFVSCPRCGYKLCKGEEGSHVIIKCPNCSVHVRIKINENTVAHIMTKEELEAERNKPRIYYVNPDFQSK